MQHEVEQQESSNVPRIRQAGRKRIGKAWGIVAIVLFGLVLLGIWLHQKNNQPKDFPVEFKDNVSFPIYYAKVLPEGFKFDVQSVKAQDGIINFVYKYKADNKLFVTQQPRPPVMEQVKKTRQFNLPIGKAYIADLNGHATGFVLTDKSLVILSPSYNIDSSKLEQLMNNLQKV